MYHFNKIEFYQDIPCEDLSIKERVAKKNLQKQLNFSETPLKLISFDSDSLKYSAYASIVGLLVAVYLRKGLILLPVIGAVAGNVITNVSKNTNK